MIILVLHGPNLGLLGKREPEIYGQTTLNQLNNMLFKEADKRRIVLKIFQSNHEGRLIDLIEEIMDTSDALIINPGALAHTSIALMDAIKASGKPTVEVHLTDITKREEFRQKSYIGMVAEKTFQGEGIQSYLDALDYLIKKQRKGTATGLTRDSE